MPERKYMLKLITPKTFDRAHAILDEAFPPSEIKSKDDIHSLFEKGTIKLYGDFEQNQLLGVIMIWVFDQENLVYISNFAIDKNVRGQGIGSKMLAEIVALYPSQIIILEVEVPYDEISYKRIKFYERNNFVLYDKNSFLQPQISAKVNETPLYLMSYGRPLDDEQYSHVKDSLFKHAYGVSHD